jgi:DNA segregation ATPase FtsK/SpoIIIE-like protein
MDKEKIIEDLKRNEVTLGDRVVLFGLSLGSCVLINALDHHPATLVTTVLVGFGGQFFYGRPVVLWGKKTILELIIPQGVEEVMEVTSKVVETALPEEAPYKDQSLVSKMKRMRYLFNQEQAPAGLFERVEAVPQPESEQEASHTRVVDEHPELSLEEAVTLLVERGQVRDKKYASVPQLLPQAESTISFEDWDLDEEQGMRAPGLPELTIFEVQHASDTISPDYIRELEQTLNEALRGFGVLARVLPDATMVGPRILRFGIVPLGKPMMENGKPKTNEAGRVIYASRTKVVDITRREQDIQLALEAESIRLLPPVPGKPYVGIEIPNPCSATVAIADVLASDEYQKALASSKLIFALGRDVAGRVCFCDIAKAPHILIAGATGSGKSVLINVLIGSLLTQATPEDVRLLMVDPKQVELTPYNGIAHLLMPVVTDPAQAVPLLKQAIAEMERRYKRFSELGVRNLAGYRKKREQDPELPNIPAWVIIIDELADLMMTGDRGEVEGMICRLAQLARAIGIHLIVATQRPSVDVITGLIKANISTRISFMVSSAVDSRTIIDMGGAEKLLGRGDMLYRPADARPERIQGAFMTDQDAESLAAYWQVGRHDEQDYYPDDGEPNVLDFQELRGRYSSLRELPESDEDLNSNRYGTDGKAIQNVQDDLECVDFAPSGVTRDVRNVAPEKPSEEAVRGQNEAVLPFGWTEKKVDMLPGFYEGLESLDKALKALKLPTSQRNRDFAREILKQQKLWKEAR